MNRGMNAAIAVHGDYAYIGSRTDGGHQAQPQGGIVVVDISKPSKPRVAAARSTRSPASRRASCASGGRRTS